MHSEQEEIGTQIEAIRKNARLRLIPQHQRQPVMPTNLKRLLLSVSLMAFILCLMNPLASQSVEAKKVKEKKILKQLVKGLIMKNLSTKKNFVPMPVPIPVPIELTEPPVYINGKPKYITIYKPAPPPPPVQPIVKPTTYYHMPVYSPTYEYMMNPVETIYDSMMYTGNAGAYNPNYGNSATKQMAQDASGSSSLNPINFTDYDDEFGSYYLRKSGASQLGNSYNRKLTKRNQMHRVDDGSLESAKALAWLMSAVPEAVDGADDQSQKRVKRQVNYESSYEKEPPCYGFPLEINIKSRIKLDQVFPIYGNSQHKKCIKVGRPLLPPVEDDAPY